MMPRIAAGVLVTALIRAVEAAGGHAMVLAKGDATSGAILLILADRGVTQALRERTLGLDDRTAWTPAGPATFDDPATLSDYIARRRRADADLWAVELDHPDAVEIANAMIG